MPCPRCLPSVALATGLLFAALAPQARADEPKPAPSQPQQPKGNWQTPGEIQQPKGTWQVPGEIQKPGEIQRVEERCRTRLVVAADALFAFDQDTLSPGAKATLDVVAPQIVKEQGAFSIEGHTDAKGDDDYNQKLSERRARAVRDWLVERGAIPARTPAVGYGESHPVAPNAKPDGSDDPEGRAKNRRVELVVTSCPPPAGR